jgi:hypothetical protein
MPGTVAPSVGALMAGLIDFAGLFPPAAMSMSDAVAAYAAYRGGADAFALGRFIVPVARLDEFDSCLQELQPAGEPWPLSVLGSLTDADAILAFASARRDRIVIAAIEARADSIADVDAWARYGADASRTTPIYLEISSGASMVALVDAIGRCRGLRAKVRTGGVTAEAFPAPSDVVNFLTVCRDRAVAFKATAGLHHPVCGDYPLTYEAASARAPMYGFLNVFLAALFLGAGATREDAIALLTERDAAAFAFAGNDVIWRELRATHRDIARLRARADGFGSCSFREPIDELRTLGLL